jgi:hypothetical protein
MLISGPGLAQLKVLNGKIEGALPGNFYLEGNAIPTEKRNAVLISTANAPRVLFALIDTTGYSSQIQQKYIGMMISEGKLDVCGNDLGVGSYGFGLEKPEAQSNPEAQFRVYDQAGKQLFACGAAKDSKLTNPKPLQVAKSSSRLYLGRYWVEVK